MLPLLLALAFTPPPSPGPTPPAVKGLTKTLPLGADVKDYVRWSLGEMGQAVVVVEGELARPLPKVATGIRIFENKVNFFRPVLRLPTDLAPAPWMDMASAGAPGNPASKTYPLGWGY